jgi:hypothetical protein
MLKAMIRDGVMEKCDKPLTINGHSCRPKSNGVELRLIFEGQPINAKIGPAPRIQMRALQNLRKMVAHFQYVAGDDVTSAFYAYKVKPEFRPHLAISTPLGYLQFCRLPMGYNRSSFVLHTHLRHLLKRDPATSTHGDDLHHWGMSFQESAQRQKANCSALASAGLVIKKSKKKTPTQRTEILGIAVDLQLKATRPGKSVRAKYLGLFKRALTLETWNLMDVQVMLGTVEWLTVADPVYRNLATPLLFANWEPDEYFPSDTYRPALQSIYDRLLLHPWSPVPVPHMQTKDTQRVYTDASGWGMAVITNDRTYGSLAPPVLHINETEALAVDYALRTIDGPMTLFCDNTATIGALRKGRSKNSILNHVARTYLDRQSRFYTSIQYISSAPSRVESGYGWTEQWTMVNHGLSNG